MSRSLVPILLAMTTGSISCQKPEITDDDRAAIRKVLDDQKVAWNAGDIDGFMKGYHQRDDSIFTSGGKIRRGYKATLEAYTTKYVEGSKMGTLDFRDIEIQGYGVETAVVVGEWELTETPEAGGGVFTLVFHQEQGRWAIVHDHTSAHAAATPSGQDPA